MELGWRTQEEEEGSHEKEKVAHARMVCGGSAKALGQRPGSGQSPGMDSGKLRDPFRCMKGRRRLVRDVNVSWHGHRVPEPRRSTSLLSPSTPLASRSTPLGLSTKMSQAGIVFGAAEAPSHSIVPSSPQGPRI